MNRQTHRPIESSGKAICDQPLPVDLAQDLCSARGWVQAEGFAPILTADGEFVADNFDNLAGRMESADAFLTTAVGALQIRPSFHSLSSSQLLAVLGK